MIYVFVVIMPVALAINFSLKTNLRHDPTRVLIGIRFYLIL